MTPPRAPGTDEALDGRLAAGILVGLFVLYWFGRSLTFASGDSPQHALSSIVWGVSWPPSYPLYTMLGHAASLFPGSPAGNVSALSGLLHAAACALLFLFLRRSGVAAGSAAFGAVSLGLTPLFWFYSEVAEVRGLNDLLAAATAYLCLRSRQEGPRRRAWLVAASAVFGLGVSHHPTFMLLAPAVAIAVMDGMTVPDLFLCTATAAVFCALPYAVLGVRLETSVPRYNLTGAARCADVLDLFTRKVLGGPFRVVAGQGLVGPGSFDWTRFLAHLRWFARSLASPTGLLVLPLAAIGAVRCASRDRRSLAFWGAWLSFPAGTYIVLASQQLRLHDPDLAYSIAARFHLLPMIAVYALAAHGADALRERWRGPRLAGLAAVGLAVAVVLEPASARGKDIAARYADEMVAETAPGDMLVLDTDGSFFALLYKDVVEGSLGDRVLLMPALFSFPPYRAWLTRRYPDLRPPAPEAAMDWAGWRALNPSRALYVEVEWKDALLAVMPRSAPAGILVRACADGEGCPSPADGARRLASSALPFSRADLHAFSVEVYILRHEREMIDWTLERLGSDDADLSGRLRAKRATL